MMVWRPARGFWAAVVLLAMGLTLEVAAWLGGPGSSRALPMSEAAALSAGGEPQCEQVRVDCSFCYVFSTNFCKDYGKQNCEREGAENGDPCDGPNPPARDAREKAIIYGYCTDNPNGNTVAAQKCETSRNQVCIPSGPGLPEENSRGGCKQCSCQFYPTLKWQCKCTDYTYKVEAEFSRRPCPDEPFPQDP